MRHKETFASKLRKLKRKKNECKSKTKQGRRSDDECSSHQDAKVPQEKGLVLAASTTHLLPEPRANGFQGIERYDTPPPVEEEMTSQMAHYKATLRQLTEVSGDGLTRRQDSRKLNRTIRIGEVVAIRCLTTRTTTEPSSSRRTHSPKGTRHSSLTPSMGTPHSGWKRWHRSKSSGASGN